MKCEEWGVDESRLMGILSAHDEVREVQPAARSRLAQDRRRDQQTPPARLRGILRHHQCHAAHPIFSNFRVQSASGLTYSVEVRSLAARQFACDCVDFRIN